MTTINTNNSNNIGSKFYNDNGQTYTIIYINKDLDRTLVVSEQGMYIVAYGIDYKNKSWAQGHYFMKNFESAVNYVLGKEVK